MLTDISEFEMEQPNKKKAYVYLELHWLKGVFMKTF